MPRFRKGTNDADGDGRKGGSLPGHESQGAGHDPGAGGHERQGRAGPPKGPSMKDNPKSPKAAKTKVEAKKAQVAGQFAEADAKADPADVIDALQVGLQVRGY